MEICSSDVSSRRATRSLYVDKQGGAIDFFQELSGCQLSELVSLRVGMSHLGGDCSVHGSPRRAARSLYVDKHGGAIDFFQKLRLPII